MTINSKQKGARYERHVALLFKTEGYENAHRTQQFCGYHGTADIEGVPGGLHIECKHQERTQIYDWLDQSKRDAREDEIPVVYTEAVQGWIPCSERLPRVGENVLFTTDIYGGYVAEGDRRADGKWWQYRWNALLQNDEVTAWMPLPTPYKGGEEDD